MSAPPSLILFTNADLSNQVLSVLQQQLFIEETMTGAEFDARVASDPNYPAIVHQQGLRILVIRSDNIRTLADITIFIKAGLAAIECPKSGRPGHTLPVAELTLSKLLTRFPPSSFDDDRPLFNRHVQNNILHPLHPHSHHPALFPFGSDKNRAVDTIFWTIPEGHFEAKGALIPIEDEDDENGCK